MDIARFVRRHIDDAVRHADQRDDVNIVSAVNVAEDGTETAASSTQHTVIRQNERASTRSQQWQTKRRNRRA
jgi:hypothetical protein